MPLEARKFPPWAGLLAALVISTIGYYFLLYHTPRENFYQILGLFMLLGLVYLWAIVLSNENNIWQFLIAAVILRLSLLIAIPELSDDFYRFIWDGRLWNQGTNPFAALPSKLMEDPEFSRLAINRELFQGLNSPEYFTVYPPLSQLIFMVSTKLFPEDIPGNIIAMRMLIIGFETASIMLLPRLLASYGLPCRNAIIYAWNPLVIVELTGNLHFEAIMIFFMLVALWFWKKHRWWWSATALGLAIGIKLIPLIFLPVIWKRLPFNQFAGYAFIAMGTLALCSIPLLSTQLLQGISSGLSLYFQKFEFNASIYYLIREAGFAVTGYNIIQTSGKFLALFTFLLIMALSWWSAKKITWPQAMFWSLFIYLLLTTTVHPWYVTTLVMLCAFTTFRFPVVWSFTIILSYGGYTIDGYTENLWLVIAEYLLVGTVLLVELRGWRFGPNLLIKRTVNSTYEAI